MIGIDNLFNSGAMPTLERVVQFTQARHRVLANNISNLSTPYFKPTDLDPTAFQQSLSKAIERRRASAGVGTAPLEIQNTRQVTFHQNGIETNTTPTNDNILFHDQNNRDLERVMARVAENTLVHRTAIEFLRREYSIMQTAISGRV